MKIAGVEVMFKYKFFNIPAVGDGKLEDELNGFLGSHSILDVKQEFSPDYGLGGSWCFCIRWKESLGSGEVTARTNRKDYKEILGEEEFSLYLGLRELRKAVASREEVPAFTVFTNEFQSAEVSVGSMSGCITSCLGPETLLLETILGFVHQMMMWNGRPGQCGLRSLNEHQSGLLLKLLGTHPHIVERTKYLERN